MTKSIAVASQKGGVGKTTTSVNLALGLSLAGKRTLLIDLDPQANATSGIGQEPTQRCPFVGLGKDPSKWAEFVVETRFQDLYLVPPVLSYDYGPEIRKIHPERIREIRDELLSLEPIFDFVIMDCPPAAGPVPTLALQLADAVLIPVQAEYYAMEGLSQMLPRIDQVRDDREDPLELAGILLTLFDPTLQLSNEVRSEVLGYFPDDTLSTVIPRDVALAESASFGQPILEYNPRAVGAWAYLNLTKEILDG